MKLYCVLALLSMGAALDDEAVLVQTKDTPWADKMRSRGDVKKLLDHSAQIKLQKVLVAANSFIRVRMARVHRRLDKADVLLHNKRVKLDTQLEAAPTMKGKALLMKDYMNETLPIWREMMENTTKTMKVLDEARTQKWAKPKFVSDYFDTTEKSINDVQLFIDSLTNLEDEWKKVDDSISEEDAVKKMDALQTKVDEGIQVLHDSEVDYTAGFDKWSNSIQVLGTNMEVEHETMMLVGEVTDNLHQECHMVGRKILKIFTSITGSMNDGMKSVERLVTQKQQQQQ